LFATGTLVEPEGAFPALGFWFIALSRITIMVAATAESTSLTAAPGTLALGAVFAAKIRSAQTSSDGPKPGLPVGGSTCWGRGKVVSANGLGAVAS